MSSRTLPIMVAVSLACTACTGGNRSNEWEDIDYSKVYNRAGQRDIDADYKKPSIVGCVDDDLFNCR